VIFQDFPGLGILKKKIQDFPGGVRTLKEWPDSGFAGAEIRCNPNTNTKTNLLQGKIHLLTTNP